MKARTDGKGYTSSLLYNVKLKPVHFEISGGVVSQNYDYYSDGRISFVHNTTDANFDRAYVFDHVGRLAEATSGGAARNGVGDTPYHETFGYDAFSNLTFRTAESWNGQTSDFDSASYTNYRRSGWNYDADGRNTTIGSRSITFDAAGRRTHMTAQQVLWNGNEITVNQTTGYDGDGLRVYEVASGITTYYLRSSVLNGTIVEELNGSGQKTVGYVSLPGGQLLATQTSVFEPTVIWKHNTPAGTTEYTMNTANTAVGRVEFDPVGADISLTPPPEPPPSRDEGEIGPGYMGGIMGARWSDFFNLDSGFVVDGHSESANYAMFFINFGSGNSSRDTAGMSAEAFANSVLQSLGPAAFAPAGVSTIRISASGVEGIPGRQTIEWQWVNYNGQSIFAPIPTAYSGVAAMPVNPIDLNTSFQPQNTIETPFSASDLDAIRGELSRIATKRCQDFLNELLTRAGNLGGDAPVKTNILNLFDMVRQQRGFVSATLEERGVRTGYSTVDGAVGANNAKVLLSSTSDLYRQPLRISYHAFNALAELTHVAGSKASGYYTGAFSDVNLAKVARDLAIEDGGYPGNLDLPTVDPKNDPLGRWSSYYHNLAKYWCKRNERP